MIEGENVDHAYIFVLKTIPDPGDIALNEAFEEQVLDKIVKKRTRQNLLNDIILNKSGRRFPPERRAEFIKRVYDEKETKLRFIFSIWPRPEPSPSATSEDPPPHKDIPSKGFFGKMTPNGLLWGATLFDFYFVQRLFDRPELKSILTGSKLATWAKANGETDGPMKACLEWAENEKDPELIAPYDIQELVRNREKSIRNMIASQKKEEQKEQDKESQPDRLTLPEQVNGNVNQKVHC